MSKQITIKNEKGEWVSVEKYDSVDMEGFVNGRAIVWLNGKAGFINENGEEICPIKYDMLLNFRDKDYPTRLKLNGMYGLIDRNGVEICPIKYRRIDAFNGDGKAFAEAGKDMFYLNRNGDETPIRNLVSE